MRMRPHGERSVELIHKRGIWLRGIRLSRKEYRIAELIIAHHRRDDGEGIAAITAEPGLSRKEKEHASPSLSHLQVTWMPWTGCGSMGLITACFVH